MNLAQIERQALVDTMRGTGPDAPTLCEGWTTRDLTAHLLVRERRPDAMPGILIKAFAGHTAKVQDRVAAGDWNSMLDAVASGPPVYSPYKLVDRWVNLAEMFVHHEDVLRGAADRDGPWTPRELSSELQDALTTPVKTMGRMAVKNAPAHVTLRTTDGQTLLTGGSGEPVTITGTPGELVLFAFGRTPVAVEYSGDPAAVAAVRNSSRGF